MTTAMASGYTRLTDAALCHEVIIGGGPVGQKLRKYCSWWRAALDPSEGPADDSSGCEKGSASRRDPSDFGGSPDPDSNQGDLRIGGSEVATGTPQLTEPVCKANDPAACCVAACTVCMAGAASLRSCQADSRFDAHGRSE